MRDQENLGRFCCELTID